MDDRDRRLALLPLAGVLRSRGGPWSGVSVLLCPDVFFGLSSPPPGMRSAAVRRRSASAAGQPNSGSFRPPFFFADPIRKTPGHPAPPPPTPNPRAPPPPPRARGCCLGRVSEGVKAVLGGAAPPRRSSASRARALG